MRRLPIRFGVLIFLLTSFAGFLPAQVPLNSYANFEGAQTNPLCLSPDGTRLFAVNTADARLSVFDLTDPSLPRLIAEIPVGLEPVSVKPRSNDEVWVVNQLSDSISIVSVSARIVIDTIQVSDEPMDVVFAGGKAFVSVARRNEIRVFDPVTREQPGPSIAVFGGNPRALAVSPDGRKVYAAFALSGNRTTIIPAHAVPGTPPKPANPNLPAAPQQGLIVSVTDPVWNPSFIKFGMPDNDVVELDVATQTISRYFSGTGTINLGLAVRPTNGDLYVANTEARNLVRFEPALRGHVVDHRITRVGFTGGTVLPYDLNPGINYGVLPNPPAAATALAQPTAMVFEPSGNYLYVAAFGSDRVARVEVNGAVVSRIAIGDAVSSRQKRGPRGLALKAAAYRLYVLNRISNTISVVDTASQMQLAEIPVGAFDPTPVVLKAGRGFLYDAKLSGNGTVSCSSCHIDGEGDMLAWDLGDPSGELVTVTNSGPNPGPVPTYPGPFTMHPMKGPMMTQTLRGLNGATALHWRGDRPDLASFNVTFDRLMGGSLIASADLELFAGALKTIRFGPNPNQKISRVMPDVLNGADPYAGFLSFIDAPPIVPGQRSCAGCHSVADNIGSDFKFREINELSEPQVFKTPQLRGMYLKSGFNNTPGAQSLNGFGFAHNGSEPTIFSLLSHEPFFGPRTADPAERRDLEAYMLCFDTGTAPAVGQTRTFTPANLADGALNEDWLLMRGQAEKGNIDLVAKGHLDGRLIGLVYKTASRDYQTDRVGEGRLSEAQLREKIAAGGTLSVMGVVPGTGQRIGIDRDLDGILDGDEAVRNRTRADFDGDGRTDISVFRPATGSWYVIPSGGTGYTATNWGRGTDRLVPADFDGDGRTDHAVFRDGTWYLMRSQTGLQITTFGLSGDIAQPGDYDGDGTADLAVWRPSDGCWYILRSRDGFTAVSFGLNGDRPVADDYDGDGKFDPAIYRNGSWYLLRSSFGPATVGFGTTGDRSVVGDYDGDGKCDVAVWRPASGAWYYLRSSDGGFAAIGFGLTSDQPSPGDYDGDGKSDLAVFRPSDANWYLIESTTNSLRAVQWGASQDLSVPGATVP